MGDLALHIVASGVSSEQLESEPEAVDLPDSVVAFLRGELGEPEGGFPEPFRSKALKGRSQAAPAAVIDPDDKAALDGVDVRSTLDRLLFPGPAAAQLEMRERFGDLSRLPSIPFLYGLEVGAEDQLIGLDKGVRLVVGLEAIGEPKSQRAIGECCSDSTARSRPIDTLDQSVAPEGATAERADADNVGHVAAPFRGMVTALVARGDSVMAGDAVATIEAMKMESTISAPVGGTVLRVLVADAKAVEPGDLVLEIHPEGVPESPTVGHEHAG